MKLFVIDKNGSKVYLRLRLNTKCELNKVLPGKYFFVKNEKYLKCDIKAEYRENEKYVCAIICYVLGFLTANVIFQFLFVAFGYFYGKNKDDKMIKIVKEFNSK